MDSICSMLLLSFLDETGKKIVSKVQKRGTKGPNSRKCMSTNLNIFLYERKNMLPNPQTLKHRNYEIS